MGPTSRRDGVMFAIFFVLVTGTQVIALGDATPAGTSYLLFEHWGGTWHDAEKSPTNTEDDLLCWAAAGSNVLQWTRWGEVDGMATADAIFGCFQDHWTDAGGMADYGWRWWFDGNNPAANWQGWAQVDVSGGGFWPAENAGVYLHQEGDDTRALPAIADYLQDGYGVTLGLYGGGAHAVTCWGYNYNPDTSEYLGLWITDSDDSKSVDDAPDLLRYYEVEYANDQWLLQDYFGGNSWYVGTVQALCRNPNVLIPGDANGDGSVDDKDASVLSTHWFQPGIWFDGDFDRNGWVDCTDAAILAAHWGQTTAEAANIPEPTSPAILLGGLLSLLAVRRRSAWTVAV
jgi:hypothetical protein